MAGKSGFYQLSVIGLGLCFLLGCGFFALLWGDCSANLLVRGTVLDADTLVGAADAALGIEAFTGGERTDFAPPIIFDGSLNFPPPAADGTFGLGLSDFGRCDPFPRPDRIDIIVVRGGCEQRFMIDVNADTVVDPTAPDDVLELKEPILVPPCPP